MLMVIKLVKSAFDSFNCDTTLTLGVHLNMLLGVLKLLRTDDKLRISCVSTTPKKLELNAINAKGQSYASFALLLISVDDYIPENDFKYTCQMKMPTSVFHRIVETMLPFSSGIRIIASGTSAVFVANSSGGESVIEVSDDDMNTTVVVKASAQMYFAALSLHTIAKFSKNLSHICYISLADHLPVQIEFPFDDEKGYFRFFLVPKFDGSSVEIDR